MKSMVSNLTRETRTHRIEDSIKVLETIRKLSSHDMKSPISAILESCALLSDQSDLESFQSELVQNIEEATHSLYDMIDRIHELVRIQSTIQPFSNKPLDLMAEMHRVMLRLKYLIQAKKVELMIQPSDAPLIKGAGSFYPHGDEFLLLTLFTHLLKMVILAAPEQCRIRIDLFYDNPLLIKITFPGNNTIRHGEAFAEFPEMSSKNRLDLSIILAYMQMTGTEVQLIAAEPGVHCIFIHIPVRNIAVKEFADAS
jgi:K+-sensing histidine kinase KdpD